MPAWIPTVALLLGAGAVDPTSSVVVEGACEDGDALQQRLAVLVAADAPLGSVRLLASRGDADAWQGTLTFEVDGVPYERALSAESCAALYEASALVIGLAVQPAGGEEESVVPGPPVGEPGAEASDAAALPEPEASELGGGEASEPAATAREPGPPRPRLRAQVQAGAGVAVGVLQRAHPQVTAGAAVAGRRWAAGLDLAYLPPLAAEVEPRTRAIVQLLALSARGCPVWRFASERVGGCGAAGDRGMRPRGDRCLGACRGVRASEPELAADPLKANGWPRVVTLTFHDTLPRPVAPRLDPPGAGPRRLRSPSHLARRAPRHGDLGRVGGHRRPWWLGTGAHRG